MHKFRTLQLCTALSTCGLFTITPVGAAPLTLAQSPAGSVTVTPPPPNLILTIDNSNSMNNTTPDPGQVGSRMTNLKQALLQAFSSANIPDNAIRLGWNTINPQTWNAGNNWGIGQAGDCSEFRTTGTASTCGAQGNILRPLTATHRSNFLAWVNNGLKGAGNTPTIHGYYNALKQYDISPTSQNSPWAEVPGTKAGDYLTCRKSYVMLLTDGDYNRLDYAGITVGGSSDLDNKNRTLGDGTTTYDPGQSYGNIYKQAQYTTFTSTNHLEQSTTFNGFNTISDLAFHYWSKDIDGNSANNNVKEMWRVTTQENGIDKFWNPKNDPATWQHINTYTVGYGATASGWATSPKLSSSETLHDSNDLERLMLGTLSWPYQSYSADLIRQEMMHAAINGRGKFYPAKTQQDLIDAIKDMLVDVIPVPEQHVTSASGSTLSALVASSAFYAMYDSDKWSGDVGAVTLKVGGGVDPASKPWGAGNTAASLLDAKAPGSRNILTSNISLSGSPSWAGKSFLWANLSTDQKTALGGNTVGPGRLDYLRGVRTGEGSTYRERATVLGDIVNSNIWFMKGIPNGAYLSPDYFSFVNTQKTNSRPDVLFVGANDGMLHAFKASNGQELFSYVPLGSYSNIANLTKNPYSHKYFVDGSPFTADFCKTYSPAGSNNCTNWGTALVGFMGNGGKGYFIIDVTNPNSVGNSNILMDTTSGYLPGNINPDPDIGYITQKPVTEKGNPLLTRQIARMNDGKWALVTGNGYNSTNEKSVLIIQYLDGTAPVKIYAPSSTNGSNGLSAPRLIDLNGDGRPDVAYAGDLKGNLYKFDLANSDNTQWKLAGNDGLIFTARSNSNAIQPITTAPVYQIHPSGGLMIIFGTGQNLTVADRSDTSVQSVYGIFDAGFTNPSPGIVTVTKASDKDGNPWSPLPGTRSTNLVQQTVTSSGVTTRNFDVASLGMSTIGGAKRGWYLDLYLADGSLERERVLRNPTWFDGDLLDILSERPAMAAEGNDPCDAVETSAAMYYTTVVNAITGNAPIADVWEGVTGVNRDEGEVATVETRSQDKSYATCVGPDCEDSEEPKVRNLLGRYFKTPSWRQMQ